MTSLPCALRRLATARTSKAVSPVRLRAKVLRVGGLGFMERLQNGHNQYWRHNLNGVNKLGTRLTSSRFLAHPPPSCQVPDADSASNCADSEGRECEPIHK